MVLFIVPESPRYLFLKKDYKRAAKVLNQLAKHGKGQPPKIEADDLIEDVDLVVDPNELSKKSKTKKVNKIKLIYSKELRFQVILL